MCGYPLHPIPERRTNAPPGIMKCVITHCDLGIVMSRNLSYGQVIISIECMPFIASRASLVSCWLTAKLKQHLSISSSVSSAISSSVSSAISSSVSSAISSSVSSAISSSVSSAISSSVSSAISSSVSSAISSSVSSAISSSVSSLYL